MHGFIPIELLGNHGEYYPGYIVGYRTSDQLVFRYVGEGSPEFPQNVTVSPGQLRKPPNGISHEVPAADVCSGDMVDVLIASPVAQRGLSNMLYQTGDLPPSWWPARVSKKGGDFIVVEYESLESSSMTSFDLPPPKRDGVVEKNQVRHRNQQPSLSEATIYPYILDIPRVLVELFKEPATIEHIVKACGDPILICEVTHEMKLPKELPKNQLSEEAVSHFLFLSTSANAIFKVDILGEEVVKMLRQKINLIHRISDISKRVLENQLAKSDSLISEEFSVPSNLVGQSIGAGGANIRRARMVEGVVSVVLNPDSCTFKVSGKTREAVENAKKVLEYATEVMHVPQEYVSRIIGQKNRHIQTLVDKVGLAKIRVQAADEATVPDCVPFAFTGTRSAINDAKLLIKFSVENFREIDQLQASVAGHRHLRGHDRFILDGDVMQRDRPNKPETGRGGDRRFQNFHFSDSAQAFDSSTNTISTFNGNTNGHRNTEQSAGETSDATASSSRYPPQSNQRRNNNGPPLTGKRRGDGGNWSSQRQNSLPPPRPKTNPSGSQEPDYPMSDSNNGGPLPPRTRDSNPRGGHRGNGVHRRQTPRTVQRYRDNSEGVDDNKIQQQYQPQDAHVTNVS